MPAPSDTLYTSPDADTLEFFDRLAELYAQMDARYEEVAAAYGFDCRGCADNCCQTRFYHHTYIETAYFLHGFFQLDAENRAAAFDRARAVAAAQEREEPGAERLMCPVNREGWCRVYPYRPMICRLHGLPHELNMPGRPRQYGPGCAEFDRVSAGRAYVPFDRTPFYMQMAALENEFKTQAGLDSRLRRTIAEMLADAERRLTEEDCQ